MVLRVDRLLIPLGSIFELLFNFTTCYVHFYIENRQQNFDVAPMVLDSNVGFVQQVESKKQEVHVCVCGLCDSVGVYIFYLLM